MKAMLLALAVVLLVSEVHGNLSGPGGNGGGRGRGRPPCGRPPNRGGPPIVFPECKAFMKEVQDELRENGYGPGGCRTAPNEDECKFQELMQARMRVNSKPSKKCLEQVNNFLSGTQDDNSSDDSSDNSSDENSS